jgi:hypothetical protein
VKVKSISERTAIFLGPVVDKIGKIVTNQLAERADVLMALTPPEVGVDFLDAHILHGVDESAVELDPVTDQLSVTSPLKHTILKGVVSAVGAKPHILVRITLKVTKQVTVRTVTSRRPLKIGTSPLIRATVIMVATPLSHKSFPDGNTLTIRISDTAQLIVAQVTNVIVRMTPAIFIGVPVVILTMREKSTNGVKTLVAVQDGRIKLFAIDSAIILCAKAGVT